MGPNWDENKGNSPYFPALFWLLVVCSPHRWSGDPLNCKSEAEQAPVAHLLRCPLGYSSTLPHSTTPCLPALPHGHPAPARGFPLVSSMQDIPFPNIFNSYSLPSLGSLHKGHPLWEQLLNTLLASSSEFLHSTYYHIEFPFALFSVSLPRT